MELTGTRLREIRLARHETQTVFAKHFDSAQSTIQGWEAGEIPADGPMRKLIEIVLAQPFFIPADLAPDAPSAYPPEADGGEPAAPNDQADGC